MRQLNLSRTKLSATLLSISIINFYFRYKYKKYEINEENFQAFKSHQMRHENFNGDLNYDIYGHGDSGESQTDQPQYTFTDNIQLNAEISKYSGNNGGCKCDDFKRHVYSLDNSFENETVKNNYLKNQKNQLKTLQRNLVKSNTSPSGRAVFMVDGAVPIRFRCS